MKCTSPTAFPNTQGARVPCGQCLACRVIKRNQWLAKLILEYQVQGGKALFVTLTYAPDHLPDADKYPGGNLVKSDLQKYIKRLRFKLYGRSKSAIRYFAVGEYGDKSQRAHYHLIIFGIDETAEQAVRDAWPYGHVGVGFVNVKSMRYVLGYTLKKMTKEEDFPDGRQPEFTLMSRKPGLGYDALPALADKLIRHNLYPARYLSDEERYYAARKFKFDLKIWSGTFVHDGKWYSLPDRMMEKLGELVDEGIGLKTIAQSEIRPIASREYKAYRVRKADDTILRFWKSTKLEREDMISELDKSRKAAEKATQGRKRYAKI